MTAEELLPKLTKVHRSPNGWESRCPAHHDQRASLSVGVGTDGRVLLTCHAGCTADAITGALGIEVKDLFPPSENGNGKRQEVATYHYRDEAGDLLFEVVRFAPKDFRQRQPDGNGGHTWSIKGVRRVPYRLPELREAIEAGRLVFIPEGERDVHTLVRYDLAATCNAGGAGKWTAELSEHLKGARVVILADNDDAGRQHAEDVAAKLQGVASEVRVVELPDLPSKGDVSQWLDAGGTVEQLKAIVKRTPVWGQPAAPAAPGLSIRSLAEILANPDAMRPPEAVIPRLVWRERVTLLAAREKDGKSTIASAGAAATSDGARFLGEHGIAGPVLWVGLEEHVGDTAGRFQSFGADPEHVFILDRLEKPFPDLAAAVEQVRPVLVVIDTLPAFADTMAPDPGSSTAWTPIMAGFTRIARDSGAGFLLLHHARKSDGEYRDSTAIGAGVDMVLSMSRGEESSVRKIKGKGRWAAEDFSARLEGDRYALAAGELSLDARVLLFVESHPGCSMRKLREGVSGRGKAVDDAADRLLKIGALQDLGSVSGRALYVKENKGGVSAENPTDTRADTVAGHTQRAPCPEPNLSIPKRDTPSSPEACPNPKYKVGERDTPPRPVLDLSAYLEDADDAA
jgi:hypothetical protein